jgi:anti-sigma B factor antagonist
VDDKNFTVVCRVGAETAVVVASGDIDFQTSPLLSSQLWKVIEQTTVGLVVLDVSDVDFVSSAGLAMLVSAVQWAERCHKSFTVVTGRQRVIPRALHVAGLERVVSTSPTYAEAAAAHTPAQTAR